MKRITVISFLFFIFVATGYSQFNCKVLVKNLQGQYNGDCKKGLAHGQGAAKGIDRYVGSFRKGYPNGFGVYTYQDSSTFIGNFKRGVKNGYGLLNIVTKSGKIRQKYGLWMADSLIIPNDSRALFKVNLSKGINVVDPKLTSDVTIKNQVWINFQQNGVPDKSVVIEDATISNGEKMDTKKRSLNTLVAFDNIEKFPVTVHLKYQIDKPDKLVPVDCILDIVLFSAGRWEINLNH